jgi:hypothetical protein
MISFFAPCPVVSLDSVGKSQSLRYKISPGGTVVYYPGKRLLIVESIVFGQSTVFTSRLDQENKVMVLV